MATGPSRARSPAATWATASLTFWYDVFVPNGRDGVEALKAGLVVADAPGRRTEMGDTMDALVDSLFEKGPRFS